MSLRHVMSVHEDVLRQGWALTSASEMGLDSAATKAALSPVLAPDPRNPAKLQALDVITYERDGPHLMVAEAESIAVGGATDDYPRCWLVSNPDDESFAGDLVARSVLRMVPVPLRRPSGRMSATYLRYTPGADAPAHQDRFGDMVVVWVLSREGDGGESYLLTPSHDEVFTRSLMPGEMLIFRDEMFLHGVTAMRPPDGTRDALVFITLLD